MANLVNVAQRVVARNMSPPIINDLIVGCNYFSISYSSIGDKELFP